MQVLTPGGCVNLFGLVNVFFYCTLMIWDSCAIAVCSENAYCLKLRIVLSSSFKKNLKYFSLTMTFMYYSSLSEDIETPGVENIVTFHAVCKLLK